MYYLDSDTYIELLRGRLPYARAIMEASDPALFGVPAIVEAELRTGALKSDHPRKNTLLVDQFLSPIQRIPFDSESAIAYAKIRAKLEKAGSKIGPNDLAIAAIAVAHNAVLVTNNTREFLRVPGLDVESWAEMPL